MRLAMLCGMFVLATTALAACATGGGSGESPNTVQKIGAFDLTARFDNFLGRSLPMISTYDHERNGMLAWRCDDDGLHTFFGLSGHVAGGRDGVDVRYRFDEDEPSDRSIALLTHPGGFTMAYLNPMHAHQFTLGADGASVARVQMVRLDTSEIQTYEFDLTGFAEAISRVRAGCS